MLNLKFHFFNRLFQLLRQFSDKTIFLSIFTWLCMYIQKLCGILSKKNESTWTRHTLISEECRFRFFSHSRCDVIYRFSIQPINWRRWRRSFTNCSILLICLESEPPQNNSWSSFTHFGPRCNRCGNPCGEDAIYHGSMAFHKDHFTCYKCGSMIKIPVFVNGEMYCKRCGKDIQPKSYTCFVCGAPRNMESVIIDEKCYCKKHFQCSICGCILNKKE